METKREKFFLKLYRIGRDFNGKDDSSGFRWNNFK